MVSSENVVCSNKYLQPKKNFFILHKKLFHSIIQLCSTIFARVSGSAHTLSIDTRTSTHATSGASFSTNSFTESKRIRALDISLVARNGHRTFSSAGQSLASDDNLEFGVSAGANTVVLEAERGLGGTAAGGQSTFEALAVGSSTERLKTGKSGIILGVGVVAIVVDVGVNELAAIRSDITGAGTTSSSDSSASSGGTSAEIREKGVG